MSKGDRDAEHDKNRLIQRWPLTTCRPSTGEWEGELAGGYYAGMPSRQEQRSLFMSLPLALTFWKPKVSVQRKKGLCKH